MRANGRATPFAVTFDLPAVPRGNATLRLAICGTGARSIQVTVNDRPAGLCLTHLCETANYMSSGAIRPSCQHDTWLLARGHQLRAPRAPTRSKQTAEVGS